MGELLGTGTIPAGRSRTKKLFRRHWADFVFVFLIWFFCFKWLKAQGVFNQLRALVVHQEALHTFDWVQLPAQTTLNWVDCFDGLQCAKFEVLTRPP